MEQPWNNCAQAMALTLFGRLQDEFAAGTIARKKLVWMELTSCSGNIISLLNEEYPDFPFLITDMVEFVYNNSLIVKEGEPAMEQLFSVLDEDFILAVEGAVAMKDGGMYSVVGMHNGAPLTAYDAVRILGERASHVIAVGACACDGGFSAASPNPSESVGVQRVVSKRVIKLPGCPCNPRWFLTTLAYILLFGEPELDELDRPRIVYNSLIHDRCPRRPFFDSGIFATRLGEPTCMFRLGCRGPITRADCPIGKWNQRINWPIQDDTPCIGCAQFGFPDLMEPFISYETAGRGPGQ